jgi:hypothetical protein
MNLFKEATAMKRLAMILLKKATPMKRSTKSKKL